MHFLYTFEVVIETKITFEVGHSLKKCEEHIKNFLSFFLRNRCHNLFAKQMYIVFFLQSSVDADFHIKKTDSPFVIINVRRQEINFGKIANIQIKKYFW